MTELNKSKYFWKKTDKFREQYYLNLLKRCHSPLAKINNGEEKGTGRMFADVESTADYDFFHQMSDAIEFKNMVDMRVVLPTPLLVQRPRAAAAAAAPSEAIPIPATPPSIYLDDKLLPNYSQLSDLIDTELKSTSSRSGKLQKFVTEMKSQDLLKLLCSIGSVKKILIVPHQQKIIIGATLYDTILLYSVSTEGIKNYNAPCFDIDKGFNPETKKISHKSMTPEEWDVMYHVDESLWLNDLYKFWKKKGRSTTPLTSMNYFKVDCLAACLEKFPVGFHFGAYLPGDGIPPSPRDRDDCTGGLAGNCSVL
ncbi:MAG: hypothetical protein Hyperionvirus7_23 [Hyperionvirus sp.]|uniref:Uncharacterized protein n=1 Tax=Hyperionvirus sp. TaxID=2487770 RepID=A0A3G5A8Q8_9VIRU|nr:MAG: hypothetical protein Hyperionvirus7_23 [Hyperionvirus sp.]